MILIITHKKDFTADFVINKLNNRQIEYKRFNCEDFPNYSYSIRFNPKFSYSLLETSEITSIWFRRTTRPNIEGLNAAEAFYISNEYQALLENLYTTLDTTWLSDPYAIEKAENKTYQLKLASSLGFVIPKTLISNSKNEVVDFYRDNNKNIIIKPLSKGRIQYKDTASLFFTKNVEARLIQHIKEFDLTPSILQENISKEYELRITVVGNAIFPAKVYSQKDEETKIDWRKKKLTFEKAAIPNELGDCCVKLVKELGLKFGAIDMIKSTDGRYIFLEINPNGQWAWIEKQTGLGISSAIINVLTCKNVEA